MLSVGVLYGGRSGEHDVSLCSAASVISALDRTKYKIVAIGVDRDGRWHVQDSPEIISDPSFGKIMRMEKNGEWYVNHFMDDGRLHLFDRKSGNKAEIDVVFPVMHGPNCEDGRLQGLLELASVPYVGADVTGSAIGMDKDVSKRLLAQAGIPVVPWIVAAETAWKNGRSAIIGEAAGTLGMPLFVKPANMGSSVGITMVKERDALGAAVDFALQFDSKAIIEKGIDAREIECSVLGNEEPAASVLGEIIPRHEFYSYESKYLDSDGAALVIPAEMDGDMSARIRKTAVDAYVALCCSGMARVDFFLEKGGTGYYLNEINTLPGFTSISMYPKLWEKSGLGYAELIDRLIGLAVERQSRRLKIKTTM
ncbi:MAG: D-alanine--D-alanine ligase [Spirochaetes bacterium]|jgi:D-alanine-D-alanine ligase|nr:D-alanine--D-alanine ligase [Spirochaetota bacterium]